MNNLSLLWLSALALFATSCAQQAMPTGGDKDTTPPGISKSKPLNESTNYVGNSVILTFDEYVKQSNLGQELIVSPPLEKNPEFKIRKKSLIISFDDSLKPNTTYTFNLGQGIVDFREGNVLDSNVFVFSTGPYLDSASVSGNVKDAFTLAPPENVLVMLYEQEDDSIPALERPYYYTKVKPDGQFELTHLKEGTYQMFALIDQNNNYLYDLPNEWIGFSSELISTQNQSDTGNSIALFQEDLGQQYVISTEVSRYGKIDVIFSKPAKTPEIKFLDDGSKPPFLKIWNSKKDSLQLWYRPQDWTTDSMTLEIWDNGNALDTFQLARPDLPEKKAELNELNLDLSLNTSKNVAKYFAPLYLRSSAPLKKVENLTATLIEGKDTLQVNLIQEDEFKLKVEHKLQEDMRYQFVLVDSSLVDQVGFSHDSLELNFQTKSAIQYASLKLKILGLSGKSTLVELRDEKDEILYRQDKLSGEGNLNYPNLEPGNYRIKMIFDDNQNGKWDPGTFIPRKQPEKVIYFSGQIEIKEGWDKELEWIIPAE
ncbi:Ig-like domain-containing protein [bacterium SCSIO 12741]|nr:Ig-like domain-containing protein [bacterium SCSIO 12741]